MAPVMSLALLIMMIEKNKSCIFSDFKIYYNFEEGKTSTIIYIYTEQNTL